MRTRIVKSMSESSSHNPQSYLGGVSLTRPSIHSYQENPFEPSSMPSKYDLRKSPAPQSRRFDGEVDDNSSADENEEINVGNVARNRDIGYNQLGQIVARELAQQKRETQPPSRTIQHDPIYENTSTVPVLNNVSWINILIVFIAIAILGAAGIYYPTMMDDSIDALPNEEWLRENLTKNMRIIRDKFPSQVKNIWHEFHSGIQKVLLERPTEPTIFLLIHQGTEETSSCLARKVGQVAHYFLNASKPYPFIVDGGTLSRDETFAADRGRLVEDYRPLVEDHRIMILDNLHLVPATLAQSLHIFCDTITPLVHKAVYIFTLNISKDNNEGNPIKIAERELYSLWDQLDYEILSALIVRITGGSVFRIHPEQSLMNAC